MMSKAQFYSYLLSLHRHFLCLKMGKDFIHCSLGGDAGVSHIKVMGILLALPRGVNYRFWSRLGRVWVRK